MEHVYRIQCIRDRLDAGLPTRREDMEYVLAALDMSNKERIAVTQELHSAMRPGSMIVHKYHPQQNDGFLGFLGGLI